MPLCTGVPRGTFRAIVLRGTYLAFAGSHPVIVRPAATLRRHPGDDLVRVGDVAGLAVHTVRSVQADPFAVGLRGVFDHLIYISRTKILAGVAKFFHAA